jgi:cytochrome c-type biogenesis protein CcmH/NrfG
VFLASVQGKRTYARAALARAQGRYAESRALLEQLLAIYPHDIPSANLLEQVEREARETGHGASSHTDVRGLQGRH